MAEDVNTPDGFETFMRKAEGGIQESQEDEGTAASEEVVPPDEGAAPPEGGEEGSPEFQAGYAKALGEQSDKLGEERAAREALEQRLASVESELVEEAPEGITEQTWEMLEGLYDSQGGAGMMLALATRPDASEDLIDAGIALWKENDYRNADLYEKRMMRQLAQIEPAGQEGQEQDPDVVALKVRNATEDALVSITSEYGREKLEQIQPHLASALEKAPERLRVVLGEDFQSGDKDRIVDAFRTLYTLAEPLAGSTVAKTAAEQRAAATRVAKQAATVATGSQASVGQGESDLPSTLEELDALDPDQRRLAVKKIATQRLLDQETSVARELAKSKSS